MLRGLRCSVLSIAPLVFLGCGSSSDSDPPAGSPAALDGVWDITGVGRGGLAEMTISGGVLNGVMVDAREGQSNYQGSSDCVANTLRTEFTGTVSGNALTSSRTNITKLTGSQCPPGEADQKVTRTFTGVRSANGLNWDGEWVVTGGEYGESWNATVNGLNVTATSNIVPKRPRHDTLTIAVAGDTLTISGSAQDLSLAAKRR